MSNRLRVAFFGSPEFAVPSLEVLLEVAAVHLVVTQPDRPAGRGQRLTPPPVKEVALRAGVPVLQPERLRPPKQPAVDSPPFVPFTATLRTLDLDLAVVVAYGKILPGDLLTVPRHGCWNVHGSLLPRWRGAAPIQHALLAGDAETGVTLMQMDEGLDTGPMLIRRSTVITADDTSGTLHERLARLGAEALREGLARLADGGLAPVAQDDGLATLAPRLEKESGEIDWGAGAGAVSGRIRAVDPWPGAYTFLDGEPLKLWRPRVVSGRGEAGRILGADRDGLIVGCGDGAVAIGELQLPGRRRLAAAALLAGRPIPVGTRLGAAVEGA